MVLENEPAKYTYPVQITNAGERESWAISTDHCYARPWNWRPDSSFLKTTKSLFMCKSSSFKPLFQIINNNSASAVKISDEELDIESVDDSNAPIYDTEKVKILMDECSKHASLSKNTQDDDNWEDRVNKLSWSSSQHKLFLGFTSILNNFYLGKMVYSGLKNEPVFRRAIIDKAAQRVRKLFNSVSYDIKLLQWIHQLLLDYLDHENLGAYLDILQTLKSKVPKFVEKILNTPSSANRMGPLNNENLLPLLKRQWDPLEAVLAQDKPKQLPQSPVIVLMPSSPNLSKKYQKWMNLLSHLAEVVPVSTNFATSSQRMNMTSCIDQMFSMARGKIHEVRENFPGKHIILVGIGTGATLALQVAQVENVFCVLSLGFSLLTAEGRRGEPDDSLLELQCPVLFVIGECSSTSTKEDMEDLRERMRIETGLIVVGSADNNLIISKKKKKEQGITQHIVDRYIIDEIGEFVGNLLLSPYPPQIRQSPTAIPTEPTSTKKGKLERKRYNSATSSIDSEPPSPIMRISRPVGRPPGKSKCKLEAKWAAQVAQGTSSSSSSSNNNSSSSAVIPSQTSSSNNNNNINNSNSLNDSAASSSNDLNSSSILLSTLIKGESPSKQSGGENCRKLRIIKPIGGGGGINVKESNQQKTYKNVESTTDSARIQAYNLGRNVMPPEGQLSSLLQGGIKTIPAENKLHTTTATTTTTPSTIRVLENVQLSSPDITKLIANPTGRTIDISKIGLGHRGTASNLMLLPDGKIKTLSSTNKPFYMKSATKFVMTKNNPLSSSSSSSVSQNNNNSGVGKKTTFLQFPQPIKTNLPPPTNLSSQDIMDLPIIFADDNQIIDPNLPTDLSTSKSNNATAQQITPKFLSPSTNKYVLVSKTITPSSAGVSNLVLTSTSSLKRPSPLAVSKQPAKYTKIILSKKSIEPLIGRIPSLSTSNSSLLLEEPVDLENEIVASTVPKPLSEIKLITSSTTKETFDPSESYGDDDDPDYVPPKNLKMY